jgi:hypothetical protein
MNILILLMIQFEKATTCRQMFSLIDEFIATKLKKEHSEQKFTKEQERSNDDIASKKALSSMAPSVKLLSLPENYKVEMIPSGC